MKYNEGDRVRLNPKYWPAHEVIGTVGKPTNPWAEHTDDREIVDVHFDNGFTEPYHPSHLIYAKISPEAIAAYVLSPNHCPYCNSNDISANRPETGDDGITCEVGCESCGASWNEIHEIVTIEEL